MSIQEFRDQVLAEWKEHDPYLDDIEGYREFFNERYKKRFKAEERRKEELERAPWLKRLKALAPRHGGVRLEDRIYKEILVKGEQFTEERKDEFREEIEFLGELMVIHAKYTEENGRFGDMFGEYLIQTNQLNFKAGQFPTPPTIAEFMVKISLTTQKSLEGEPKQIMDPCAGTGGFMLKTAKHYAETIGKMNFIFYNVDIDFRMYVFCTMNAILNGIPSVNVWGDSLALKFWEGTVTIPIGGVAMWKRIGKEKVARLMIQR